MLVVIGIIGLIAAVLTPGIISQFGRAKSKTAQLQLDTIAADIESFSSDVQRYPTEEEGLKVLLEEPADTEGWSGPYLRDRKMLNDPWGRPIVYMVSADKRTFTIKSLGADGKAGGAGVDRDLQAPAPPESGAPASGMLAPPASAGPPHAVAAIATQPTQASQ
jgi:general secretion pathway protein G